MSVQKFMQTVREHIDQVIEQKTALGIQLWQELSQAHPVDIADLLEDIDTLHAEHIFKKLPRVNNIIMFNMPKFQRTQLHRNRDINFQICEF